MAHPMRPSARGSLGRRRRPREIARRTVADINQYFVRGPRSLRPSLRPETIETVSVAPPSTLSGMDDFRMIQDPGSVGGDDQLGFSLRPPKWLRKASVAVRRNVTLKRTLAVAGGVAAIALAPVAAPFIATGARFIGREIAAGGRGILGLFNRGGGQPDGPPIPSDSPFPSPPGMPTTPTAGPPLTLPTGGGGGGEGGAPDMGPLASPDVENTPPTTAGVSAGTSPTTGLLIAGGLVLATVMLSRIKKRKGAA